MLSWYFTNASAGRFADAIAGYPRQAKHYQNANMGQTGEKEYLVFVL